MLLKTDDLRQWIGYDRKADMKARGITRHKTNFGGHRDTSGKMRKTYVRDLQIVEATE